MVSIQRRETWLPFCTVLTAAGAGGTGGRHSQAGTKNTKPIAAIANHCADQSDQTCDTLHAPTAETTMPKPKPMKCTPSSGRRPWRINQPKTKPAPNSMPVAPHKPPRYRHSAHAGIQVDKAMPATVNNDSQSPML